jgi:hypothetical protein
MKPGQLIVSLFVLLALPYQIIAQSQPLDIVPSGDYYYLSNWPIQGKVKSLKIHRFQPRNPGDRFSTFESCRGDVSARHKYHEAEDYYLFNKKGQLIKRTISTTEGKETALYEYNYFNKVSAIQMLKGQIRFTYDGDGRLIRKDAFEGVQQVSSSDYRYIGDTVFRNISYLLTGKMDSTKEVHDQKGRMIYVATRTSENQWKEEHFEYDMQNRVVKHWNSNNLYFEYVYDEKNRVIKTFVGRDKAFMSTSEFDDVNGICRTSRCELIGGDYIERNYDCVCTAIDGQNNPIRREFIDCSKSGESLSFGMNGFLEVEYGYFK